MTDDVVKEILNAIKESMTELKDSQKEIQKDIGDIKITQAEQHVTLLEHTKRSTANEEEIRLAKQYFQEQLEPLKKDNYKVKGALALLGLILSIVTILSLLHKV